MNLVYIGLLVLMCSISWAIIIVTFAYLEKVLDELLWKKEYNRLLKEIKTEKEQKITPSVEGVINEESK